MVEYTLNTGKARSNIVTGKPCDVILIVGAINTSLFTLSLYSGFSESPMIAIVEPIEYPITSILACPVMFKIKSMTVVRSYIPISWKLESVVHNETIFSLFKLQ